MNKKEIYYKFIFTDYHSLTINPNGPSYIPTDDGVDQRGEVRILCNQSPGHVITYDQLTATNPVSLYVNGTNGWTKSKKDAIKQYIDQWKEIPKYFNLRNYWDNDPPQEGGMSLMVSHSPEVGGDYGGWTKFTSTYDNKTVYCALMVSSGDFFYNWALPNEILVKSNLRDRVVSSRFHSNWYFTPSEKDNFKDASGKIIFNCDVGQEKRIFVQHYFNANFPYGYQAAAKFYVYYYNGNNRYLRESVSCVGKDGNTYVGTNKSFPAHSEVSYYYLTSNPSMRLTRSARYTSDDVTSSDDRYYLISNPSIEVSPIRTMEEYRDINEDLKRDFIDLEVTRRILHYDDNPSHDSNSSLKYVDDNGSTRYVTIQPTGDIPKIISGKYHSTQLSYEPPQVYLDAEPLQIKYNLLRYAMNDRPPFGDCETVLIMWVANNGDPDTISATDSDVVKKLHDLDWQQYAIPVSIRCCFKEPDDSSHPYCTDRFLVSYPNRWDTSKTPRELNQRFHIRCGEGYNKNVFREALYLRDLVEYSQDYVISLQDSSYFGTVTYRFDRDNDGVKETVIRVNYNDVFDTQRYLFKRYSAAFKQLYAKKIYGNLSMNQQQQTYYIRVDDSKYSINSNNNNIATCIVKKSNANEILVPSEVLLREDYENKWDFDDVTYEDLYGLNDWAIEDNQFITLFDAKFKLNGVRVFNEVTGELTIADSSGLKSFLDSKLPAYSWEDFYLSSLGFSTADQMNGESLFYGRHGCTHFPLGFLDNHLKIGSTTYGRTINSSNNKVVVGFNRLFDHTREGLYHFKYINNNYVSVVTEYNASTGNYYDTPHPVSCTAYVMNYTAI